MKKIISILLATILLTFTCISTSANESSNNIYLIDNKTIIFGKSSAFTTEEQQRIAELLVNADASTSTYGLMCTLFGHKNTSETVTTITHCVYEKSPRCMQENFIVTTCSRCGETTTERVSFQYITCCPEN